MDAFDGKNSQAGRLTRNCIDENQSFTVKLLCRDGAEKSVQEALIALGLFGGLGSRARHGMGSVSLMELRQDEKPIWKLPESLEYYLQAVRSILADKCEIPDEPPYSAFSQNTRLDVLAYGESPYSVLQDLGRGELLYRSWGKGGRIAIDRKNGKDIFVESEKNFELDHHWKCRNSNRSILKDFHPRRLVFGLPLNYGKEKYLSVSPEQHDRRASPLLFHIHALGEKSFIGVSILLRSVFLPTGEKINAGGIDVPAKIEWNILTEFLDGKDKAGNPRFPHKVTV
jgi:CRISPR-associated protein Cmr1